MIIYIYIYENINDCVLNSAIFLRIDIVFYFIFCNDMIAQINTEIQMWVWQNELLLKKIIIIKSQQLKFFYSFIDNILY